MYKNRPFYICIFLSTLMGYAFGSAQFNVLDPIRVSPHIYENIFENERLRVLKVTERNGETAALHEHPETLIVYLSSCAWMEKNSAGISQMSSFKLGEVTWRPSTTHGGDTSKVIQDCSRLEIEVL